MGSPRVVVIAEPTTNRPALYERGTCSRDRVIQTGQTGVDISSCVRTSRVPQM